MSEHATNDLAAGTPDLREITAKNICALRTSRKMTQLELGEALSYSDKAISKWERGEAVPDAYVLLDLSRLFGVSVDWILSPHSEDEAVPRDPNGRRRAGITLLSFFGVWAVATLLFVVLAIVWEAHWQVFVYAIPASLIVLLIFNAIWGRPRRIFLITGGLIASIVLAAYIATLAQNLWQLFLLLPPSELLVLLSRYLFKKK
jgi:transcriptional regulator with XRE-family HTH domain